MHLKNYFSNDCRLPKLLIDQHVICDRLPEKCHTEQKGLWVLRSWWERITPTYTHTHLSAIDYLPGWFTHTHTPSPYEVTHVLFHRFYIKTKIILLSNQQYYTDTTIFQQSCMPNSLSAVQNLHCLIPERITLLKWFFVTNWSNRFFDEQNILLKPNLL